MWGGSRELRQGPRVCGGERGGSRKRKREVETSHLVSLHYTVNMCYSPWLWFCFVGVGRKFVTRAEAGLQVE